VKWFRDKVVDDYLENGSDYHYGGEKSDTVRYVVLSEGGKKPAGRWLRSGGGKVISPERERGELS